MVKISLAMMLAACSYDASFRDCVIQCASSTNCPDSLTCGTEGFCRLAPSESTQSCRAILGDAGLPSDTPISKDAPSSDGPGSSTPITLSQTPPDVATAQAPGGCWDPPSNSIYDDQWYRVFPLTGTFKATDVSFWVWRTSGATNATVTVGSYSGGYPAADFTPAQFTHLGTTTVGVSTTGLIQAHLPSPVTVTGQLVVEVSTTTGFLLGGVAADTPPQDQGFIGSSACGGALMPIEVPSAFIITVTGAYQ